METLLEQKTATLDVAAGSNLPVKMEHGKPGEPAKVKESAELSPGSFSTFYTWRGNGTTRLNCGHAAINANSRVVASISEYNTDPRQNRFIGDAAMLVYNVAPYNGGVVIRLSVGWNSPLNVRVDVFVEP
jgi:hypothetical protein